MIKGSDRFEEALNDLKEIVGRGGLTQDKTTNDSFETMKYLVDNIVRIGRDEGLSYDIISDRIDKVLEPQRQRLDNLTLMDYLVMLLKGSSPDENGAISITQHADLPHDSEMAKVLFNKTMEKFFSCSEAERRKITRSDPEFVQLVKDVITSRSGFKNELEAFGTEIPLSVPRLKRGKELFWHPSGELEAEISSENRELSVKFESLTGKVLQKVEKIYPDLYIKLREYYDDEVTMITNTDNPAHYKLVHAKDEKEFNEIAVPAIIDALVISFLVSKDLYMNPQKRKRIRKRLIDAVLIATI